MNKISRLFIVFILSLSLIACSDVVTDKNISLQKANNASKTRVGFVALTTNCKTTYNDKIDVDIHYIPNGSLINLTRYKQGALNTPCNLKEPQYYLLKLPAGKWQVSGVGMNRLITKDWKPIDFEVYTGKITYIGRINIFVGEEKVMFAITEHKNVKFSVLDESKQDIPVFLNKFPLLPSDLYLNRVLQVN